MRKCLLLTTMVLLAMPTLPLDAQLLELQPGTRVRVRAPAAVAGRVTGVVLAQTNESVTVTRPDAAPVIIPLRDLTSLEISRGKSRARGAGKGALWGGGTMGVLGLIPFSDRACKDGQTEPDCERIGTAENAVFAAIGGALFGALIGAAVGSEHWQQAALPSRVYLLPQPIGPALGMTLRVTYVR